MTDKLFTLPSDAIAVTSDDCYTPRWVFDAMGLEFDLDVAAPPGGPWHVPAKRYYTAEDDGLSQPWDGLVWCNPPYSSMAAWVDRWLAHDCGVLMGIVLPQVRWTKRLFEGCDALAFCGIGTGGGQDGFIRPDGRPSGWPPRWAGQRVVMTPPLLRPGGRAPDGPHLRQHVGGRQARRQRGRRGTEARVNEHDDEKDAPKANVCEHHYMWSSPAGSRHSARLCMGCYSPDPEWLNRLYAGEDARRTLRERLYVALVEQRAIDSRHYGEAPYAPVTWEDVDSVLPSAEGRDA